MWLMRLDVAARNREFLNFQGHEFLNFRGARRALAPALAAAQDD
jgi:hypothetical protein